MSYKVTKMFLGTNEYIPLPSLVPMAGSFYPLHSSLHHRLSGQNQSSLSKGLRMSTTATHSHPFSMILSFHYVLEQVRRGAGDGALTENRGGS